MSNNLQTILRAKGLTHAQVADALGVTRQARAIAKLEGSHRKLFCNFAVFAKPDAPLNDRPFAHLPTPIFAPVRPSTRKSSPANRGRFPESLLSRDSAEFLIWVSSADVLPDQFS